MRPKDRIARRRAPAKAPAKAWVTSRHAADLRPAKARESGCASITTRLARPKKPFDMITAKGGNPRGLQGRRH